MKKRIKKKELEKRLREEFEKITPNRRDELMEACRYEHQLKAEETPAEKRSFRLPGYAALAACAMIVLVLVAVAFLLPNMGGTLPDDSVYTVIYIDVNPSIELYVDDDLQVIDCRSSNRDGEELLNSVELNGTDIKEAIGTIVDAMQNAGYLSQGNNSMLVSVDRSKKDLLVGVTGEMDAAIKTRGLSCAVIGQSIAVDSELQKRAEENGVSVGKMYFAEKISRGAEGFDAVAPSELANMSLDSLVAIYSSCEKDPAVFGDDVISGESVQISRREVIEAFFKAHGLEIDESAEVSVGLTVVDKRVAYIVVAEIGGVEFSAWIDCLSGEVIYTDTQVLPDDSSPNKTPSTELDESEPAPQESVTSDVTEPETTEPETTESETTESETTEPETTEPETTVPETTEPETTEPETTEPETTEPETTEPETTESETTEPETTESETNEPEITEPETTEPETTEPQPEEGIEEGSTCPDIPLKTLDGENFTISDLRGKVVVLNFWFNSCSPCLRELPHFAEVSDEYADKVTVVAAHIPVYGAEYDLSQSVAKWVDKNHPEWNDSEIIFAWDIDFSAYEVFEQVAFPYTVIIDERGVIRFTQLGMMSKNSLIEAIEKICEK